MCETVSFLRNECAKVENYLLYKKQFKTMKSVKSYEFLDRIFMKGS